MFDIWKNVMMEIEQEIPHSSFVTWFDGVSLVSIENKVAKISAPNPFKRKQLEVKYDKIIRTALANNNVDFESVEYIQQATSSIKKRPREVDITVPEPRRVLPHSATIKEDAGTGLNSEYTLSNFVEGSNNDLAVSVAKSVIKEPGGRFNPFFLYGGPGLGKTHLVQAIGNELVRQNPNIKILYMPVNKFYSDFIAAIRKNNDMETFRKRFRKLDVLIIDDFQLIANKEKSQVEFFDIFNELYLKKKQIIVTSDRLPSEIETVDTRLASRLSSAGAIDMQLPSFEDKCAILRSKAEFMGVEIEDEAIEYLAENIKTNIRDLEGEFNKLLLFSEVRGMTPLETLRSGGYNSSTQSSRRHNLTAKQIIDKVAKFYDLSVAELKSKSRVSHIKNARQVAMYLLSDELSMSTPKIALEVGVKDHTTVMHGIKKIKEDLKNDFNFREQIKELRGKIYE